MAPAEVAPVERRACSITGISTDPDWGLVPSHGLYEFKTDRDRVVRLHNSDLTDLTWQPGDPAKLTMRFRWDLEWIPDGQEDEPVTVFEFTGVTIKTWTDSSLPEAQTFGQVSDFHWNFGNQFDLDMYDVSLTFQALSLHVRTEA